VVEMNSKLRHVEASEFYFLPTYVTVIQLDLCFNMVLTEKIT
jgi:hypothetical protein